MGAGPQDVCYQSAGAVGSYQTTVWQRTVSPGRWGWGSPSSPPACRRHRAPSESPPPSLPRGSSGWSGCRLWLTLGHSHTLTDTLQPLTVKLSKGEVLADRSAPDCVVAITGSTHRGTGSAQVPHSPPYPLPRPARDGLPPRQQGIRARCVSVYLSWPQHWRQEVHHPLMSDPPAFRRGTRGKGTN